MNKYLLGIIAMLYVNSSSAQTGLCSYWPRFDQEVFTTVNKTSDITYGSNTNYQGQATVLKMDIYEPDGDTMLQRPLIIFAHGGSFVAGDKSNSDQVDLCTHFAKRGYVTATINYRLGIAFPIAGATATDAVYRATQDMKAAIRYFRADASLSNTYKIDTSIIFIGGTSAGAFTALHTAYLDTYAELPATVDTAVLGDLEGNSGTPGYSSQFNAVINLCGALGDANWVLPGDKPLVSMHGTNDGTVPYASAMLYLLGIFPILVVDGSYAIHDYVHTLPQQSEMYTWHGAGHVPYDGGTATAQAYLDTTLRFVSNFLYKYIGCTPSNPNPLANTFTQVGVQEVEQSAQQVTLVGNPANEFIYLNCPEKLTLELLNSAGVSVKSFYTTQNTTPIPTSELAEGLYFIRYSGVDNQGVLKLIVQH